MAILNKDGKYIRTNKDGNIEIYGSIDDREQYKSASDYNEIIKTYEKDLSASYTKLYNLAIKCGLDTTKDYNEVETNLLYNQFPNLKKVREHHIDLVREFNVYSYLCSLKRGNSGHSFPIMKSKFPDIENTIPNIDEFFYEKIKSNTTQNAYIKLKKSELFGETTDC